MRFVPSAVEVGSGLAARAPMFPAKRGVEMELALLRLRESAPAVSRGPIGDVEEQDSEHVHDWSEGELHHRPDLTRQARSPAPPRRRRRSASVALCLGRSPANFERSR